MLPPACPPVFQKDGYTLRPAAPEDAEVYYRQNYCPLDAEAARLTGAKAAFSRDEVIRFFHFSIDDPDRRYYLLQAPDGTIAGEGVINEIDWALRSANLRLVIFRPAHRGRGLGTWMVRCLRDLAFETLSLHRLSLDVFSFNPRARAVYEKCGFRVEGVLRHAVQDGGAWADDILMAMLENEWRQARAQEV